MQPPTPTVDPDVGPYASEADTWNSRLIRGQKALFDSGRARSGDPAGIGSDAVKAHLLEALAAMGVEVGAYDERIITHVARFYEHSTCQVWLGLLRRAYAAAAGRAAGLAEDQSWTVAVGLISELVDPDRCEYDHHDYCQAHGLADRPCPHQRAKEFLAVHRG